MNLEIFNRVNWKESYQSSGRNRNQSTVSGMYSKWTSLTNNLYNRSCSENLDDDSVLCKFSTTTGKQVSVLIVKQLASNLGITQPPEPSNITSEKEVCWCMEVICYGLTLPLTEHDTVRDCVNVYCEWLSALYPAPKISVPIPVCKEANFFARKIIAHFLNLFVPRNGEGTDVINKQAVLCHRVLRTLQQVTQVSKNIENDTWQTFLLFLLTINDALLAPPTVKDDVGDQLCERVLSVLLEIWLLSCSKCYPTPPLWKTMREMAMNWRHRTALIEQWHRINLILTSKILEIMYGISFPQLKIGGDEDLQTTINSMTEEALIQTWFRILHFIGNPVDLCHSSIISQTPQFLQYAITNDNPSEHPCLAVLPLNFFKAIKGIASLVDVFLGIPVFIQWEDYSSYLGINYQPSSVASSSSLFSTTAPLNVSTNTNETSLPTPPSRRRLAKSFSVASSKGLQKSSLGSRMSSTGSTSGAGSNVANQINVSSGTFSINYLSHFNTSNRNTLLSPLRPKCNSILHLFGEWLFEASYNVDLLRFVTPSAVSTSTGQNKSGNWTTGGDSGSVSSGSISSFLLRKGSSSQPNSLTTDSSDPDTAGTSSLPPAVFPNSSDKFICGRAEAVGTLCRIFCAKKTGEEILPIYLSRFYMMLQQSLRFKEYGDCDEVMTSVLLNSADIFSLDLDGALLLVPYFIEALEIVLPERNLRFKTNNSTAVGSEPQSLVMNSNIGTSTNVMGTTSSSLVTDVTTAIVSATAAVTAATVTMPATSSIADVNTNNVTDAMSSLTHLENSSDISLHESEYNSYTSTTAVSAPLASTSSGSTAASTSTAANSVSATAVPSAVPHISSASNTSGGVNAINSSGASASNINAGNSGNSSTMGSVTSTSVPIIELRKACIHLLLSLLPLPLHFQNLPIKEFGNVAYRIHNSSGGYGFTFGQLKSRLVNLLIGALQVETDSSNTHLLLGGLLFVVQDSALCEQNNAANMLHNDGVIDGASTVLTSDPAHSLFIRSMYLVCHRLISSWKADLNISLAALEFLTGLARIKIPEVDILECKRAVKWLCDYIVYQCWRPPQAHSKDLHSSIVAAFQCAAHWLIYHPSLLKDKECLNTLLEVVELGISGTKSQGKPKEPVRMKDEKELKPASMRVRDAAEALLMIVIEQADFGPNSVSCLLDEVILMKQCNILSSPGTLDANNSAIYDQAVLKFHYFLFENNVMIALQQEPLGNDQDPQPTITLLIRNCFGRHAWTLQLRHLPRCRSTAKQCYTNLLSTTAGRPISMAEAHSVPFINQRYFPDSINKIEAYKADKAIPSLENIDSELHDDKLESLIEDQHMRETESGTVNDLFEECNPPTTCQEFYTARMFLCHFGLLSKYRGNKQNGNCSIIALDNHKEGFAQELKSLDMITRQTCDTCHVFYVKAGQKRHIDILENTMSRTNVSQNFLELVYSLGWPVKINQHVGWTGHKATSCKMSYENEILKNARSKKNKEKVGDDEVDDGVCLYDGTERILYWADSISEVAFIVPSLRVQSHQRNFDNWYERSVSVGSDSKSIKNRQFSNVTVPTRTLSLDSTADSKMHSNSSSTFLKKKSNLITPVMLVWLENFEDHTHFPINELLPYTDTGLLENDKIDPVRDCYIIFLHALQNGLLKIKLQGPSSRINIATPLVDGMIISRRSAGQLIRQTVLNICKRRRVDCDSYQLPHVRRRLKIQEMKNKYECKMNPPELLTYLLSHC